MKGLALAEHVAAAVRVPSRRAVLSACGTGRAASGQAEAKWMRMRAAFSITRAPILRSFWRIAPHALGPSERHPAWHGIAEREHQPVGRGVEDQPELVGEGALAGGAGRGELHLVLLDQLFRLSARTVGPFIEAAGGARL